jgi:hypothetical protein
VKGEEDFPHGSLCRALRVKALDASDLAPRLVGLAFAADAEA